MAAEETAAAAVAEATTAAIRKRFGAMVHRWCSSRVATRGIDETESIQNKRVDLKRLVARDSGGASDSVSEVIQGEVPTDAGGPCDCRCHTEEQRCH